MPNVTKVEKKSEKNALIHFDVGEVAWSPDYEVASKLEVGKPLPNDWTVREGDYGPQALPPKPKGQGLAAAWRNTKEGFQAEQEGRLRWQEREEERRDKRTALMQARELFQSGVKFPMGSGISISPTHWSGIANEMYTWLRAEGERAAPTSSPPSVPSSGDGLESGHGPSSLSPSPGSTSSPAAVPAEQATTGEAGSRSSSGGPPQAERSPHTREAAGSSPASEALQPSPAGDEPNGGQESLSGESGSCPPHSPDYEAEPRAGGRLPCKRCRAWVREGE